MYEVVGKAEMTRSTARTERRRARRVRIAVAALAIVLSGCTGEAPFGGIVQVTHIGLGAGTTTILGGYFAETPLADIEDAQITGCTTVDRADPCVRITCNSGSIAPSQSAGTLELMRDGATLLSATPDGGYGDGTSGLSLSPGDALDVSATGGLVPAFGATVTLPEGVMPTLPTTISRAAPLTISWPATVAAERATVGLTVSDSSSGTTTTIACTVPAAEGSATIDARLFEGFESGTMAYVGVSTTNAVRQGAGDYDVEIRANHVTGAASATLE